jgi:hypothetical protein
MNDQLPIDVILDRLYDSLLGKFHEDDSNVELNAVVERTRIDRLRKTVVDLTEERDRYWTQLCKIVALGQISPESAPYAEGWAAKLKQERDDAIKRAEAAEKLPPSPEGNYEALAVGLRANLAEERQRLAVTRELVDRVQDVLHCTVDRFDLDHVTKGGHDISEDVERVIGLLVNRTDTMGSVLAKAYRSERDQVVSALRCVVDSFEHEMFDDAALADARALLNEVDDARKDPE